MDPNIPSQPIQEQPSIIPPTPQIPQKGKSKFIWIIVAVIVLLIVGSGSYYLGLKKAVIQKQATIVVKPTAAPISNPTITPTKLINPSPTAAISSAPTPANSIPINSPTTVAKRFFDGYIICLNNVFRSSGGGAEPAGVTCSKNNLDLTDNEKANFQQQLDTAHADPLLCAQNTPGSGAVAVYKNELINGNMATVDMNADSTNSWPWNRVSLVNADGKWQIDSVQCNVK